MRLELDLIYETKNFNAVEIVADVNVELSKCNSDVGISDGTITDIDVPVFYYNKTGSRCSKSIQKYLDKYFTYDDLADAAYSQLQVRG